MPFVLINVADWVRMIQNPVARNLSTDATNLRCYCRDEVWNRRHLRLIPPKVILRTTGVAKTDPLAGC